MTPPLFKHQVVGIDRLVKSPEFALFDEMGLGKCRQVIEAAQHLCAVGEIQQVMVVCPAPVKDVWYNPDFGELAKFHSEPVSVEEYHAKNRVWCRYRDDTDAEPLEWIITNYEFVRSESRLDKLVKWAKLVKTLLVLDESSAVKNHRTLQTKACLILRRACSRVILLNGTPITQSPGDLYSQAQIMGEWILGFSNYYQFRARYAEMGGWQRKQIVGWHRLEELQTKLAPYVLRREKADCLDLPPKLPPITLTAALSLKSWKIYKDMRSEMIAWLDEATPVMAAQAGVRALRLSQITSGFLGGIQRPPLFYDGIPSDQDFQRQASPGLFRDFGSEKLDLLSSLLLERFEAGEKVLVWCRFRHEIERILALRLRVATAVIWGGQPGPERLQALRLLDPTTAPPGPALVLGTPASGAMGLNLTASYTVVYFSNDYSLKTRLQSEDRVHRPGQTKPVTYFDIVASGPAGQQTIDHAVLKALRRKEEISKWTVAAWRTALEE